MEICEGLKIDRLEFTFDVPEGFPTFGNVSNVTQSQADILAQASAFFGRPVTRGPKPFFYQMQLTDDVMIYFSDRRGENANPVCGKLIVGSKTSNDIPFTKIISRVKPFLPSWVLLRRLCRIDIAADRMIPFSEFCQNIAPLGLEKAATYSNFYASFGESPSRPETFQFGKGDVVLRLYDKQKEQKVDHAWSRAEFQFRGQIIRHAGNAPNNASCYKTLQRLVAHGLRFWRPLKEEAPAGNSSYAYSSDYWLELFSLLAKRAEKLSKNVYYV